MALAQNEMKAKGGMPERVSSNEGLGRILKPLVHFVSTARK